MVDHLIERSIVPALTAHLEKIAGYLAKGDAAAAAREFFDFRVADLAMGSGHFLVAAVDKIEALMRTFLTEHSVPGVTEELLRLAAVARDALGTDDVAKSEVDEVGLLRRQVARRCIYGLDINPMAVELARLALWIHTFVPGLPMSNLDHGLVNANSLTGIGTIDEALDALQPGADAGEMSLFDEILTRSTRVSEDAPRRRRQRERSQQGRGRRGCAPAWRRPARPPTPLGGSSMQQWPHGSGEIEPGADPRRGLACSVSSSCPRSRRPPTNSDLLTCRTSSPRCSSGIGRDSTCFSATRRGRRSRSRPTNGGDFDCPGSEACRRSRETPR